MRKLEQFATRSPLLFGLGGTILFVLLVIMSTLIAGRWPAESAGWYAGNTAGRLISIAVLLLLLAGLSWLRPAGFATVGRWQTWLLSLVAWVYATAASAYAMTQSFDYSAPSSTSIGLMAFFIMTAAFLEEVVFRGLILHNLVRVWGSSNRGLVRAVVVASCFFGGMHLVNVLGGQPLPQALLQGISAFFLGIFLGALVLNGRSIYPAFVMHGFLNLASYLNLTANGLEETTIASWLMLIVIFIPLAAAGIVLIRSLPKRPLVLKGA